MPYEIKKQGDKHCVVKKDTGETVKCHDTEAEAMAHMKAMYTNVSDAKSFWITREQMKSVCPSCAKKMTDRNIKRVNLYQLPNALEIKTGFSQGLCDKVGDDPGFFTKCKGMNMEGVDDMDSFCAELHKYCLGDYPSEHKSIKGWVTINGRHILIDKEGGEPSAPASKPRGYGSPHEEFRFVQQRLAAGGLKRGEKRLLERRSEALAKRVLGVNEKTYKGMMGEAGCIDACQECMRLCMDCVRQMESCPNRDATHDACIQKCKECAVTCQMTASDLAGDANQDECKRACEECSQSCMDCVEELETVAEKCDICREMCEACSESCGTCSEMCDMNSGKDAAGHKSIKAMDAMMGDMPDDMKAKMRECMKSKMDEGMSEEDAMASCKKEMTKSIDPLELRDDEVVEYIPAQSYVAIGGEVKSLGIENGKMRIGGLGVVYGSPDRKDLTGEWFSPRTRYGKHAGDGMDLMFIHGLPISAKNREDQSRLNQLINEMREHEFPAVKSTKTDEGIFGETILDMADKYEAMLARYAEKGKLKWSTGTADHTRSVDPNTGEIKKWLISEWSLTPTPAEPRLPAVLPIKSLQNLEFDVQWNDEAGGRVMSAESSANSNVKSISEEQMTDEEKKLVDEQAKKIEGQEKEIASLKTMTIEQDKAIKSLDERAKTMEKALKEEKPNGTVQVTQKYPYKSIVREHSKVVDSTGYGEFLSDVVAASQPGHSISTRLGNLMELNEKSIKAATGMNAGIPSQGGFFVQTDHSAELVRSMFEEDEFLGTLRKLPLAPGTDGVTINGVDETSRASNIWGGILAYWLAEADAPTASKPKFREIKLEVKGLGALYYATDKLLKLAPTLGAEVSQGFREAMSFKVKDAVINGTGAGKPLGIINSGSIVSVGKETNQTAATIVHENVSKMKARMFPSSFKNAVWLANIDTQSQWDLMSFAIGTAGVLSPFIRYDDSGVLRVYGRPVIFSEHCQTLGTTGDLFLWDPSSYYFIDLGAIEEASSIHVAFTTFDQCFRFGYYCDGQPKLASALTPAHGSSTLTTHVKLDTRS